MMWLKNMVLWIVLWAAVIASAGEDKLLPERSVAPELNQIVRQIDIIRERYGMASAYVLMVDQNDVLVHQGLGIRAWDDPRPVTDQDYYRLGSISKAFTGLALLKAQEQGCLKLTDQVRQLTPDALYTNRWEATHPLTMAMLMEHTAGWHDMSWFEFKYNDPVSLTDGLKLRPDSRIAQWPPGTQHIYSNTGPGVAGWVLEQVCNADFDRYIEQHVFQPLNMASATMNRTPAVAKDIVGGYNTDPKEPIRYWNFLFRPAGSMNVRPIEMTRFLQMLLNRGKHKGKPIFSAAQIDRMETPTTSIAARTGMDYGYGLGIYSSIKDGHVIYGHGGDADGYLTRFSYSKESGRAFFVVITMFDHQPLRQMREVLESWLVEGLAKPPPPTRFQLSDQQRQTITGTYQRSSIRFPREGWEKNTLVVLQRNKKLEYRNVRGRWRELIPVSAQHFRHQGDPVATVAIVEGVEGVYLQGDIGNWEKPN